MGKYYLENSFKKLDKAKQENEMLKNEIIQWEALFNCREITHSAWRLLGTVHSNTKSNIFFLI